MAKKRTKIGFVGVGRMGANMARRLADCGYPISAVYDSNAALAAQLAEELSVEVADSLADVTARSKVVITVVSDDKAMKKIFKGKKDNLLVDAEDRLFINCATVSPKTHRTVQKLAHAAGALSLEACMASSIPQARDGSLYLMLGGEPDALRRAKPVLEHLAKAQVHVGEAGRAAEVKALVNMVMNSNTAALAEGLGLGYALGHDLNLLCEIFSQTGAASRVLTTDAADMINREHDCFFSAEHAAKDTGIALKLAKKAKLNLPVAAATLCQYEALTDAGHGQLDKSAVAELTFPDRKPK